MDSNYKKLTQKTKSEILTLSSLQDGWKEESQKGSSTLFTRKYNDAPISLVKIISKVPSNIEKCKDFYFEDLNGQHECKEDSEFIKEIEKIDENTKIVFSKLKGKMLVSGREILVISHLEKTEKGYIVLKSNLDSHSGA